MIVKDEIQLRDFDFWGGAYDTSVYLTPSDFKELQEVIEEKYPNGINSEELNDLFMDSDGVAMCLGYDNWEDMEERREEEEL